MKQKIVSFIETVLSIAIIGIISFVGIIIYEYYKEDIVVEVQEFVSNITVPQKDIEVDTQKEQIYEIEGIKPDEKDLETNKQENYGVQDKYFYKQLDEYSKIIYNALHDNKENMITGTYQINFGEKFSKLLSKENGQELLGKYYQTAIEAYTYDNPDVFYIDYSKLYLNTQTKTIGNKNTYNVYINSGNETNYLEEEFNSAEKIEDSIKEIKKIKKYFIYNKKQSTYENIKLVHNYLVESIDYDETQGGSNIYNIYGALVNKRCVCEGYAEAFKYLMDALEIPCIIVTGEATNSNNETENHAWDYVQIDNIWYAIDCTWDDPIILGPQILSNLYKYKYFLKGENEFKKTHNPKGQFTEGGKIFIFPTISIENY